MCLDHQQSNEGSILTLVMNWHSSLNDVIVPLLANHLCYAAWSYDITATAIGGECFKTFLVGYKQSGLANDPTIREMFCEVNSRFCERMYCRLQAVSIACASGPMLTESMPLH